MERRPGDVGPRSSRWLAIYDEVVLRSDADKGKISVKLHGCDRQPSGLSAAWVIHPQLEVRVL